MEDYNEDNPEDVLQLTVPLFIRLMEYAKEDAPDDMALHKVTENLLQNDRVQTMDDYDAAVNIK